MEDFDLGPIEFGESFKNAPGSILLDVRTPDEFNSGHLPGALNININGHEFHEQVEELDPSKEYFVYCRSGSRSTTACRFMQSQGIEKVHNLKGGIIAWEGDVE